MRDALRSFIGGVCVLAMLVPAVGGAERDHRGLDVEVWVDGRPLDEFSHDGRRYVEARDGAEYELKVHNPLSVRVAVALSVDGLNTIDASRTPAQDASKWVILPDQTITIRGWQMSSSRARRFYFTNERDSYAARLGRSGDRGLISAVFFRERTSAEITSPQPYLRRSMPGAAPSAGLDAAKSSETFEARERGSHPYRDREHAATGIGRSVDYDVRRISMDLESAPIVERTIRYEFHPDLIRLGVLPRPRPEPLRGSDESRFCPEP